MTVSDATQVLENNLQAHSIGSGYSMDCSMALAVLHQEWFKQPFPTSCRPCVIAAAGRVFNYYINTYKYQKQNEQR